jgi:uncharacterized iron-regulated protein
VNTRHDLKIKLACARSKTGRDHKVALELLQYTTEAVLDELTAESLAGLIDSMHELCEAVKHKKTFYI